MQRNLPELEGARKVLGLQKVRIEQSLLSSLTELRPAAKKEEEGADLLVDQLTDTRVVTNTRQTLVVWLASVPGHGVTGRSLLLSVVSAW